MIRNKKFVIILSSSLLFVLLAIVVAYAAMQATLIATTNSIMQTSLTWDIGFVSGTVTGQAVTNNSGNISCGTATATATTISGIYPTLSDIGDECSYTFTIRNDGDIAGKISAITFTPPSDTTCTSNGSQRTCGDITYTLHYNTAASTTWLAVNDIINAKSGSTATTKTVVLTIKYTGDTVSNADFTQSGFSYTVQYTQY